MNLQKSCLVFILFISYNCFLNHFLFPENIPKPFTLRIGIDSFPVSLNPVYATNETSQAVVNKVFDSLFYFGPKGEIKKQLVENWQILKKDIAINNNDVNIGKDTDKLDIIIDLKKGIYFSDGKELDSEDVLQTFKLLQDQRFRYPYMSSIQFIDSLKKLDKHRFSISLHQSCAIWKKCLTFKILNSNEIKKVNPENFRNMILSGTGPYKIKKVQQPQSVLLERKCIRDFQKEGQKFQFIKYTVISYPQLSPLKLINNEIDICELQPEAVDTYKHKKVELWRRKFHIIQYKKYGYTYLVFNLKNSLITKDIRSSFYNLLIHGEFLKRFLKGKGEVVHSPFLPLNKKINPVSIPASPLERPLKLKILTNSESKLRKKLILFLRKEMRVFNIFLEPIFLEYQTFLDFLKKGRFDIAISGYTINIDYDIRNILASDAYFNYAQFQQFRMDKLLLEGLREMDSQKREKIYMKAHSLWQKHLPIIPLFNLYYYIGVSNRIDVPHQVYEIVGATGDFLFNILDWQLKKK